MFQAFPRVTTELKLLPPTILKPVPLWSGKQVLSTIIINITPMGKEPVSLHSSAKIGAKVIILIKLNIFILTTIAYDYTNLKLILNYSSFHNKPEIMSECH